MVDNKSDIKKFNFPDKGREFIRKASVYEALKFCLTSLNSR